MNCGNGISLNPTSAITIETWVKFSTLKQTSYPFIVGKYVDSDNRQYFTMFLNSTQRISVGFVNTGIYKNVDSVKSDFVANQWYYIAWTYDANGGTNNLKLYVDGVLDVQTTVSGTMATYAQPLILGSANRNYNFFNGRIDEVHIWNQSLTADTIMAHYLKGLK